MSLRLVRILLYQIPMPEIRGESSIDLAMRRGGDRRHQDRRTASRSGDERRHGDRRKRAALGGLLLTALSLGGVMHQGRPANLGNTIGAPTTETRTAPEAPVAPDRLYDAIIAEASAEYGVDPELVRAVIRTESRFDPMAESGAGAKGLMQLMPILSKELGVEDPFNPRENIFGGVKYLSRLLDRHHGDVTLALASYNAGPRNVARYKGVPPFKETRGYVKKINKMMADARDTSGPVVATADLRLGD
jgi:transglycosylase-like protein with SLT domain